MGVRQEHYVDFGRVNEKIAVLLKGYLSFALKQAAV
jgi:hypothetical protein